MINPLEPIESISLDEYVDHLNREGIRTFKDREGFFWRKNEKGVVTRLPTFEQYTPMKKTIDRLLMRSKSLVASYVLTCTEKGGKNTFWYQCDNHSYSLEDLPSTTRRHIRRSLRELRFEKLDWEALKKNGFLAFKDTRERTGLSDGRVEIFEKRFSVFLESPGHHVIGAWKNDEIIAFMTLVVVGQWVEIGGFSTNEGLKYRPNNGLVHVVLDYFLTTKKYKTVSYGFSSIQEKSNAKGLHNFKLKCGFKAVPVNREFAVNKLASPFVNIYSLKLVRGLLVLFPKNRWLKKGGGMLSWIVEKKVSLPG